MRLTLIKYLKPEILKCSRYANVKEVCKLLLKYHSYPKDPSRFLENWIKTKKY